MRILFIPFIFLVAMLPPDLNAQVNVQNNGIVFISNGTDTFFINGSYTNASTAVLTNNGLLYIKRDLTNYQASMATGTGTLHLNGTMAQIVAGTQMFKTYNLNTNNSAGITLNNDLSLSGAHTFTAGIITSSAAPSYLIYQAGSSYSGDGDSRHVNGWVKKIGTTAFTFPVGNATQERTIGITGLSVSSEFNAHYYSTTPNKTQLQSPLISLDAAEYWALNKVSGGSASVVMNWDNSKVSFPNWILSAIAVANYSGSLWMDQGGSAAGNVATTGTITSNSISSFNLFTFGSRAFVVPITLMSFTANRINDYIHLEWKTANEYNFDHFSLERSNDGSNFYSIEQVAGRNSGQTEAYSFNDKTPINNVAYYRLRSIDIDTKSKLSFVVTVRDNSAGNQMSLVVNPVHDRVILQAGLQVIGLFDYRITTTSGQLLQQGRLAINNGGQYQFPLNQNIIKGAYILTVTDMQKIYSFKLIVN
ncbi:MAG: type sorting protein [Chitinophagaceae bacterium]|nr:type sorting protein [Chitinophagaceae bacterium]